MSTSINSKSPELAKVKAEYLEAQRKGDKVAMQDAKQRALQIKSNENSEETTKTDSVEISEKGKEYLENSQKAPQE